MDGASYQIVPANKDPSGGFCVRVNRDIEGESNMACMLYLRRKERERAVATETKPREETHTMSPLSKVKNDTVLSKFSVMPPHDETKATSRSCLRTSR